MPGTSGKSLPSEQVLTLLAAGPPRMTALTAGLAPAQLRAAPNAEEWSANEVLAHLRACGDMWGGYIAAILAEERPTLRAVNPRAWVEQTNYRELDFRTSLGAFATQRGELLAILEPLPPDGWSRAAMVTGAGRPLERTILDYARRLALHERPHVRQIERIATAMRLMQAQQ